MARRKVMHRLLIGTALLVVVVLAGAAVVTITQLTVGSMSLAKRISELATRELLGPDTRLTIADVSGNGVTRLSLSGVQLEVAADGGWQSWCRVESIEVEYALRELLAPGHRLRRLRLRGAVVELPAAGGAMPRLRVRTGAGTPRVGTGAGSGWQLDRLELETAAVHRAGERLGSVALALGVQLGDEYVAVDLEECRLDPARLPALTMSGPLEIRDRAVYLEAVRIVTAASQLAVSGVLDGLAGARLRLELEPLDLVELASVTGWELLESPSWVRGSAEVAGAWNDLTLSWDLQALLGVDRVESFRGAGELVAQDLVVEEATLRVNGVPLAGEGRFSFRRGAASWGRVEFRQVSLASFPVLRSQAWLPDGFLTGAVRVGSAIDGVRPFALEVSEGAIHGFVIEPGTFRGAITAGGVVRLDTVHVTTRGGVLIGDGTIDPHGGLDLRHAIEMGDLHAFLTMLGLPPMAGAGVLRLAVIGPLHAPAFSATGRLDSLVAGALRLEEVDLRVGPGILGREPTADMELTAARSQLGGRSLGQVQFRGNLREQRLRVGDLRVAGEVAEVAMRGHVAWFDGGLDVRLDEATGLVGGRHLRTTAPLVGRRRGTLWHVQPFGVVSEAGALRASGQFDPQSGQTELDLSVTGLDLAAVDPSAAMHGRVNLRLTARGRLDSLTMRCGVDAIDVGTGEFNVGRLALVAMLRDSLLSLERLEIEQGGLIEATGAVRLPRAADATTLLKALGRAETWQSAEIDLSLTSAGVDLAAWHGLADTIDRLDGQVAVALELSGAADAPSGTATVGSSHLLIGDEVLADLAARVRFQSGWIHLDELSTTLRGAALAVHGGTPVRFSLLAPPRLDRAAPLSLTINLVPGDLALSPFISDRVVETRGPVTGWVMVTGTIEAPHYDGELDIRDATLRLDGREEVLRELAARVVLRDDAIHIDELRARSGDHGRLAADGVVQLHQGRVDSYAFDVTCSRFPVRSTGEYLAEVSGSLNWTRGPGRPKPLAVIDADLTVHRLDYLREVVGGGGEGASQPSTWIGRLAIELPRNAWIRNEDLELEFKGQLNYEQEASGQTMLGSLEIIRGTYDLFGRSFRITRGDIQFVDPQKIDPELDIEAETRVTEGRIRATITGRASDRQMSLYGLDEDLDQASLWAMLVPTPGSDMTNLVAMTPFIRDFERRLSREIPGLSVSFEVADQEGGAQGGLGARVGTYVSPEVFVSAYQGFASTSNQDVAVEYQLSDLLFLRGEAVRRGVREGASDDIEREYNLELNFRWEF